MTDRLSRERIEDFTTFRPGERSTPKRSNQWRRRRVASSSGVILPVLSLTSLLSAAAPVVGSSVRTSDLARLQTGDRRGEHVLPGLARVAVRGDLAAVPQPVQHAAADDAD